MIKLKQTISDLIAELRRPGTPVPTWLMDGEGGSRLGDALRLAADRIYERIGAYAELAGRLPGQLWTAERKGQVSRSYYEGQEQVLRMLASAQRRAQEALPGTLVPPQQLEDYAAQMEGYDRLSKESEVGLNLLLDIGLLQEGFGWFVVREVIQAVLARLEDPAAPAAEKEELRVAFGDLLRYRDLLAQLREDSSEALSGQRAQGEAALKEAEMEERFMQVQYGAQHGQLFDRRMLEEVAVWWEQRKKAAAAPGEERKNKR